MVKIFFNIFFLALIDIYSKELNQLISKDSFNIINNNKLRKLEFSHINQNRIILGYYPKFELLTILHVI